MRYDDMNGPTARRSTTIAAMLLGLVAFAGVAPLQGCGDKVKVKNSTIEESELEPDLDDGAELDENDDVDLEIDDDDDIDLDDDDIDIDDD
ncbi:MAG TPA: hypothetical protein VFF69_13015 [Phycisphaerales bacterium]|nr:hypothetical protein [Phycisphaerales bacterium]